MGSEYTSSHIWGLGRPIDLTVDHINPGGAYAGSYTQASPIVGEAVPESDLTTLRLRTSGTQSDGTTMSIRTLRANPPAFAWKPANLTVSGVDWRGRDVTHAAGWKAVFSTAEGYNQVKLPHCVALPDGQVIAVAQTRTSSVGVFKVDVKVYDPSTDTWSTAKTLHDQVTATSEDFHPCLAYDLRTNHVYCAHWLVNESNKTAGVRIHRGTYDGSSGTWTWTIHSSQAIDQLVDIQDTIGPGKEGYDLGRLRMAINPNGQALLVGALVFHNSSATSAFLDTIVQYASSDGCGSFRQVAFGTIGTSIFTSPTPAAIDHDVLYYNGRFVVAGFVNVNTVSNRFAWIELPHAYASFLTRFGAYEFGELYEVGPPDTIFDSAVALGDQHTLRRSAVWADEDGTIFAAITAINGMSRPGRTYLLLSTDRGLTWKWAGDGDRLETTASADAEVEGTILYTGDPDRWHAELAACSTRGRQLVFSNYTVLQGQDPTSDEWLSMIPLGGYSTVELPSLVDHPRIYQRDCWDEFLPPLENFTNLASVNGTASSSAFSVVETGVQVVSTSGQNEWTSTFTADPSNGAVVLFEYTPVSGGSLTGEERAVTLEVGNGSSSYSVTVRLSDTQLRVHDDVSSTIVTGSGNPSTAVTAGTRAQVLLALANGLVSCWKRDADTSEDRGWTVVLSGGTVTEETSSPASSSTLKWGHKKAATTATTIWGPVGLQWNTFYTKALAAGPSNPDDLHGRLYPPRATTVGITDGVRLSIYDGNASEGEEYQITADAEFPLRYVLHSVSKTPRVVWQSQVDQVQQLIPIRLNTEETGGALSEDGQPEEDLLYVLLRNINFHQFSVDWHTASSGSGVWTSFASIDSALTVDNTRVRNGTITLDTTGTNTQDTRDHVFADEYAGCNSYWGDNDTGNHYQIVTHTAGKLDNSDANKLPRFTVRDSDGTETVVTSRTLTIIPRDVLVVIAKPPATTFNALRLNITAQTTREGYYEMGMVEVGTVRAFGSPPEWGRSIEAIQGTIEDDAPDGARRSADVAPGYRRASIAWPYAIEQSTLMGSDPDGEYLRASTISGDGPIAARHDVPWSLQYLTLLRGTGRPVVYLPALPQVTAAVSGTVTSATSGQRVMVFNRRHTFIHGYVASTIESEQVVGLEGAGVENGTRQGEMLRVANVVFREVV